MNESIQQILSRVILTLLKPLVRILLRNGVAYGSFAEMAKKTYVDVAFDDFPPKGKKQTISHVSTLTGLTRKEARRLHELDTSTPDNKQERYNRVIRVISGWINDTDFLDQQSRPRMLPLEGESASFSSLVKKYSGDVTTRSMLTVLLAADAVEQQAGNVKLVKHAYVPGRDPGEKLNILGIDSAELIATIDHNLTAEKSDLRFQRKVSEHQLRTDAVAEFHTLSSKKSQALLEEMDAWLNEHQVRDDDEDVGMYVSLGIYLYEHAPEKESS